MSNPWWKPQSYQVISDISQPRTFVSWPGKKQGRARWSPNRSATQKSCHTWCITISVYFFHHVLSLDMCRSRGTQLWDWPLRLDWLQQPNECHIPMPSGFRNILRKWPRKHQQKKNTFVNNPEPEIHHIVEGEIPCASWKNCLHQARRRGRACHRSVPPRPCHCLEKKEKPKEFPHKTSGPKNKKKHPNILKHPKTRFSSLFSE